MQPKQVFKSRISFDKKTLLITLTAGFFLALHFATWIISLNYTTIANSVILVDSAPLFALLLSKIFLKEKTSKKAIILVLVALVGAALIGWGDIKTDPQLFKGDVLAIVGAIGLAVYLVCGRVVRQKVPLTPYLVIVYGFSALFLLIICLINNENLVYYPLKTYLMFALLAILPTIGGHSLFLYALKYLKAYIVNIGFLGEPVGAAILALIFFGEVPEWHFYIGGFLILSGVIGVMWYEEKLKK